MTMSMSMILYPMAMTMLYEHHRVMALPLNLTNSPRRMVQFNGLYAIHTQSRFKASQFKSQVKTIINIQISTQIFILMSMTDSFLRPSRDILYTCPSPSSSHRHRASLID